MEKRLKRKVVLMVLVELLFLALVGRLLFSMQTNLSVEDQKHNIEVKLDEMDELIENADKAAAETTASFDETNKGKVGSVAFMYQNEVLKEYTAAVMQEMKTLLDVHNVMIIDKKGNLLAKAERTQADFTRSRYNQLRTVFETGEPSEPFEVEQDEQAYRYYGAKIDSKTMVVVEEDTQVLRDQLDRTSTWKSILEKVTIGLDGYAFAIDARDYTFLYYPDETVVGTDTFAMGLETDVLQEGKCSWMTVNGERLYGGVHEVEDVYIVCAVTEEEILASQNMTIMVIVFAIFVVLTLVVTYAFFLINAGGEEIKVHLFGNVYRSKTVAHKLLTVSIVGVICITGIAFYMQTIYSLSRQSMSNNQRVQEIEKEINGYDAEHDEITEEYNASYLNKARIAAYAVAGNQETVVQREKLAELSQILSLESVNVFDDKGVQVMTNSPYTVFSLSTEPEEQSYEFWKLLQGVDSFVQAARSDDVSGELHQYIGVTLRDKDAIPRGFVQISVIPSRLGEIAVDMEISNILQNIKVGKRGIVFAIDKTDGTFAYHPTSKLIGREAKHYGITDGQLADQYAGYMTISGKKYYASSLETDSYYVYAAVPDDATGSSRIPLTLATAAATLLALGILILLLTIHRENPKAEDKPKQLKHMRDDVDVEMPDGTMKHTSSAASRWSDSFVKWNEKSPEQKFIAVLRGLLGVFAAAMCFAVLLKDQFFDSNSVFLYVLEGKWARGVNIFALTGSFMIICVIAVIAMILQRILSVVARTSGAKGETVCRLLKSLTKYISMIAGLYYCLALIGIDTATLLASAGILTLIVGLGAQTLVSDILAGLFIIFEGEFQVGDIVTIGDWRGTVVEIGVRTTKIKDGAQNIKVISNSAVSGVINMTREYSFCSVDVGIEYGESLERVENVLEKEFPNIREHLPAIVDGPFYKGVVALADNSVNLRIVVLCAEADRFQMERDLNREMKLIFDKHEINVPFPQVVINQPVEFKKATEWEKMKARKFTEQQKELAANLSIEEDNDEK